MRFTKMQGCGNDYIYVNCFDESVNDPQELAVRLSDRHYGIGSDGLILIEPSEKADAYMHMFNRDGSEAKMCGNGVRCTAKYIYDHGIIPADREKAFIDTGSGVKEIDLHKKDGKVVSATVDMGHAVCRSEEGEILKAAGMELKFFRTDTGNHHAVFFLDDNPCLTGGQQSGSGVLDEIPLDDIGPEIEHHEEFPDRVNAEFAEIISRREVSIRVWERGSGETLACGTGATATVAAGYVSGRLDTEVTVHLKGGDLVISYDTDTGRCLMTGPATEVYEGNVSTDR